MFDNILGLILIPYELNAKTLERLTSIVCMSDATAVHITLHNQYVCKAYFYEIKSYNTTTHILVSTTKNSKRGYR